MTEIALVATVLLGGLAMARPGLAAGVAVTVTSVLMARTPLHRFVRSVLSEDEVKDALIFAAASLIALALLPDEQLGPFDALNPHAIWIIVILVMAIGALGHIAVRLLGAHFGLPIAGLASGFISSIATISNGRAGCWDSVASLASGGRRGLILGDDHRAAGFADRRNQSCGLAGRLLIPLTCAGATARLWPYLGDPSRSGKSSGSG